MPTTDRSITLPCSPDAAAHARQLVVGAITELFDTPTGPAAEAPPPPAPPVGPSDRLSELIGDAQLIATELIANALHAGCQRLELSLSYEAGYDPSAASSADRRPGHGQVHGRVHGLAFGLGELVIDVYDDAPGRPVLHQVGPREIHGRGLALIAALTRTWGVRHPGPGRGKHVWAALAVPPHIARP